MYNRNVTQLRRIDIWRRDVGDYIQNPFSTISPIVLHLKSWKKFDEHCHCCFILTFEDACTAFASNQFHWRFDLILKCHQWSPGKHGSCCTTNQCSLYIVVPPSSPSQHFPKKHSHCIFHQIGMEYIDLRASELATVLLSRKRSTAQDSKSSGPTDSSMSFSSYTINNNTK